MLKKVLLFIIYLIFSFGVVQAATYPTFLHTTLGENGIHPTGDFILDITYEDVGGGIDTTTDNLKLYKYDGSTWGADIASSYVNFGTKSIGKNHAIYSFSGMPLGKYKYIFTIDNINGNSNSKEVVFYVDRPEFNINTEIQHIGTLTDNLKFLSPERLVTVKSIGAPYTVTMTRTQGLDYVTETIPLWNGTKGWGYTRDPYNSDLQAQSLSALNTVILNNSPLKPNQSGVLNNDILRFKAGAKEDIGKIAGLYEAELKFDINFTYCPEYNLDNTCKTYGKFIKTIAGAKKWEDGTIAKSCYYYKYPENSGYEYLGEIGDGEYWIQPDIAKPAFKAYCDMTSNGGGWTQYVDIKGDYTFQNGVDCWLGTNIDNANLKCFNPNRYGVNAVQLFNDEWNGAKYYYNLLDPTPSITTTNNPSSYRQCLGHGEYMTIMRANQTPLADGSDAAYVRLGRDFCKYSRDPAGRSVNRFMNYDPGTTFGENSGAARQVNAKLTKLYFREVDLGYTQNDKTIINDGAGIKKWSDNSFAKSCNEYKNPPVGYVYGGATGDGEYWIDSDGIGGNAEFKVICDMSTDGGGWTQIRNWKSGATTIEVGGLVIGGENILMTYKRLDDATKKYALKLDQFKLKHCGEEYTTASAYSNHLQTGSWGSCGRNATTGDYNDIKTTEIIAAPFVEDTCVNGNNYKNTSRNTSWWVSGGKGQIQFRVSNTTVLMGPNGNGSSRCAGSIQSGRKQTEVQTWVR